MPIVRKRTWLQMAPRSLVRTVTGMGDTIPQGPVTPDVTTYYDAGLAFGSGGTPGIDLSAGFPSADAQAAFVAGANAASSPVTLAQTSGAVGPGGIVSSSAAPAAVGIGGIPPILLWVGGGLLGIILLGKALR